MSRTILIAAITALSLNATVGNAEGFAKMDVFEGRVVSSPTNPGGGLVDGEDFATWNH